MNDRAERSKEEGGDLGDVAPGIFRRQLHEVADWIADYRANIEKLPVAPRIEPGEILSRLPPQPPERGESFEKILADIDRVIVPGMVHWSHPSFVGYFGWTTTGPGILGELISAPLNVNAMMWRTSPAATELEMLVLDWLRQWVGLPDEFGGVVYDTASVGVMHALAVAREEAAPETRRFGLTNRNLPTFRIYASDQAHSSAEKAAIALGIGQENVRRVPTDSAFQMDVQSLRQMITQDRRAGFEPLACIATVGTTSTAAVDPVSEIVKICRAEKIWLHIDGAYGGGLAILPEHKSVTNGWSEADSIVINPHKMLFVPLDFSVLYVRDLERLRRVFTLVPEYLRADAAEMRNYMDYGIQLGRRFRALKAWVVFRSFGHEGLCARIREHLRLARLLGDWIESDDRFELVAPVTMGVICFRFIGPPNDASDKLNSEIVQQINAGGRAYLTLTELRGRRVMRVGLGNVLTTEQHLREIWRLIQETATALG